MRSYFTFNDFDSRTYGILLEKAPPIQRGQERLTEVTIPGRAGELTILEADGMFKSYTQKLTISVKSAEMAALVSRKLVGRGRVTFSTQPHLWQYARVTAPVELTRISSGFEWYTGELQLKCEPYKYLWLAKQLTLSTSQEINNSGDAIEQPTYTLTGSGDMTITVNGTAFTLEDIVDGCIVDCENKRVLSLDGTSLITTQSSGDFPELAKGFNTVAVTGATGATLTRRERFL